MEQKCTLKELIEMLNKITIKLGFGRIEKLTFLDTNGYYSYEKN